MATTEGVLSIIAKLATLIIASVTALWAYTKYILERGLLPPIEFYMTGNRIGRIGGQSILDIRIHLHNKGSATLVARDIRLDLKYITRSFPEREPRLFNDHRAGRLIFPYSLLKDVGIEASQMIPEKVRHNEEQLDSWLEGNPRGFLIVQHDTFVQAGVDQVYTFVTAIPEKTQCVLAWCSFEYAQKPSAWQKRIAYLSRHLGLIQYTLDHAVKSHTAEEVFWVAAD